MIESTPTSKTISSSASIETSQTARRNRARPNIAALSRWPWRAGAEPARKGPSTGRRPARSSRSDQAVAHAVDGLDGRATIAGLELLAQVRDVHRDPVGQPIEVVAPHVVGDLLATEDLVRMAHEVLEECELLGCQVDATLATLHLAGLEVEAELADDQAVADTGRRLSPRQGADPGQQLGEGEGLGQVVVGAGVQPRDPVLDRGPGGQHQDRRLDSLGANLAANLESVHPRQHHVPDDQVVVPGAN